MLRYIAGWLALWLYAFVVIGTPGCTKPARKDLVTKAVKELARAACKPTLKRCIAAKKNPCPELISCQKKRAHALGLLKELLK